MLNFYAMSSIESLKLDFNSQISDLKNICNDRISENCIFVGSGDSYVAGLMAEFATDHKCNCLSPSDLLRSRFSKDKVYCFISVTGKTKANIEVARRATLLGARTIAVTLNRNSKLAQTCKEIVPIRISANRSPAVGFGTFVPSVVTCMQIAGIKVPSKFAMWQKKGIEMSLDLIDTMVFPKDTTYLLGNKTLYAVALYSSLKMSEFFCATAVAHKLEEFCHSPIFGVKQSDHIWIMGQKEEAIGNRLRKLGLHLSYVELYRPDIFARFFVPIFFVQNLMLLLAKKYGYEQLQYPLRQEILKASSDIIYHAVK
jgi:fructoselysine-6-P-deglycase FrlB-like protein